MRLSAKLSLAFSITAGFLLAVGLTTLFFREQTDPLVENIRRLNLGNQHLGEAIHSLHSQPTELRRHLAWLNDYRQQLAPGDAERETARQIIESLQQSRTSEALAKLEELRRAGDQAVQKANERLLVLHRRASLVTVLFIAEAITLVLVLYWLVRNWIARPLLAVHTTARQLADGQLANGQPAANGADLPPGEFAEIGVALTRLSEDQRAQQERLLHVERLAAVGEASTHLTGNLRTTLNSIRTLAQYEGSAQNVDPNARAAFEYIIGTTNKLDAWIRDLHAAVSSAPLRAATQQIEPVVRDALSLLHPVLAERGLQVDFDPGEDLPAIRLDRSLVEQALIAVITNAIEASDNGATIHIRTRPSEDGAVLIAIEDRGAGMPEETKARAFQAFYTTKPNNTGLGLTIARALVSRHRGEVLLESQAGRGTSVTLKFPAATAATAQA